LNWRFIFWKKGIRKILFREKDKIQIQY
jgi:hypothetical protein